MSNAHPMTGLQNSYKYHINYIYSTINNNSDREREKERERERETEGEKQFIKRM